MLWIVAHLAAMRLGLPGRRGVDIERPEWAARFARDKGRPEAQGYPNVDEVLASLEASAPAIGDALATMPDTQWRSLRPAVSPWPTSRCGARWRSSRSTTRTSWGQLAYLRRWLGYPGRVG